METIDLSEYRYDALGEKNPSKACAKPLQKERYKHFLASIPLEWISRAAVLPGRALHAAVAIRHLSALQKTPTVKMQRGVREQFGLTPDTYNLALRKLVAAGLVEVRRSNGQAHTVTIIEI
jgi:hypothetical protein